MEGQYRDCMFAHAVVRGLLQRLVDESANGELCLTIADILQTDVGGVVEGFDRLLARPDGTERVHLVESLLRPQPVPRRSRRAARADLQGVEALPLGDAAVLAPIDAPRAVRAGLQGDGALPMDDAVVLETIDELCAHMAVRPARPFTVARKVRLVLHNLPSLPADLVQRAARRLEQRRAVLARAPDEPFFDQLLP